jgi:hypothetical protein
LSIGFSLENLGLVEKNRMMLPGFGLKSGNAMRNEANSLFGW